MKQQNSMLITRWEKWQGKKAEARAKADIEIINEGFQSVGLAELEMHVVKTHFFYTYTRLNVTCVSVCVWSGRGRGDLLAGDEKFGRRFRMLPPRSTVMMRT